VIAILGVMTAEPPGLPEVLVSLRVLFDETLHDFLAARGREIELMDPDASGLVDEVVRLLDAGGKRLRPTFCYWGYRAGGGNGDDGRIVRAAAALELLHTMALIHDDLMDEAKERRDVESSKVHLAADAQRRGLAVTPERFGLSSAILVGDFAAVLADRMFLEAGFAATVTTRALDRYHRMRTQMAVGQFLDVAGSARSPSTAKRVAWLKGGAYTVEGPLVIGASLADASIQVEALLRRYGEPLGQAFQLRDDLEDRDAGHGATRETVNSLVDRALRALDATEIGDEAVGALRDLAKLVAMP
jgi:geranylgeranyl diphosphate synthase type I